jgi:hypothetical protein
VTWRLATVGYLLIAVAWALGNPVSAAPDEPQNAVKAYATATGQLRGAPYASPVRDPNDPREAWFRRSGRVYDLPPRLVPPTNTRCYAFDPHMPASCQDEPAPPRAPGDIVGGTQLARYLPVLYAPAGVAFATASSYDDGVHRARLVNAALFAFLVGWALRLAGRRTGAGVVVAVTPMVVFLSASVSTSGLEAAGGVLLWVAALRAFSGAGRRGAEPWVAMAVGGAVVALGRGVGPPMVVAIVAVAFVVSLDPGRLRQLPGAWRRQLPERAVGWGALAALALAVVAGVAWTLLAMPHPPLDLGVARDHLGEAWRAMPEQLREAVGVFGWLDTRLSETVYRIVGAVVVGALIGAVAVDRTWRALVLVAIAIGAAVLDIAVAVLIEAQIGYGMQARYVLAFAVGVPVVAAWLLARRRALPAPVVAATFVAAGVLHVVAFVTNANRYDVALVPEIAIAIMGALLLGASGLLRLGEPGGGIDATAADEHLEVQV